jgi:hypothetical protein
MTRIIPRTFLSVNTKYATVFSRGGAIIECVKQELAVFTTPPKESRPPAPTVRGRQAALVRIDDSNESWTKVCRRPHKIKSSLRNFNSAKATAVEHDWNHCVLLC